MGYDIRIQDVASLAEWASGASSSVGRQLEAVGVAAGGVAALDDFRGQAASNARAYWGDAVAPVAKALGVAFQDLATRCALYAEPYTGGEIDSSLDAHLEQGSIQDAARQLGDMRSDLSRDASDLSSTLEPALGMLGCDAPDGGPADGALSDAATVADDLDKRVSEHESWHSGDCGRDFEAALSGLRGSLSRLGSYAGGASYAPGDFPQSPQGQDLARSAAASGAYVGEHRAAAQAAMRRTAQREQEAAEERRKEEEASIIEYFKSVLSNTNGLFTGCNYGLSFLGGLNDGLGDAGNAATLELLAQRAKYGGDIMAFAAGMVDAVTARDNYYATHPELPEDVRESNSLAEFDINAVDAVLYDKFPFMTSDVAKEGYNVVLDTDFNGDGNTLRDDIYYGRNWLYQRGL
ncbi:hypothetical protein J2S71_000856 [Olsenella profusa DSM 13989]|uniref:hypothetical protein n=1 Tax=Olsenella profusa TaxID=138595 RepID=UPI002781F110|nr:hypothetical protein [Olsenella profusa]MDP9859160.1 hypothetical protein [Olsenella profusa DSM 13989]